MYCLEPGQPTQISLARINIFAACIDVWIWNLFPLKWMLKNSCMSRKKIHFVFFYFYHSGFIPAITTLVISYLHKQKLVVCLGFIPNQVASINGTIDYRLHQKKVKKLNPSEFFRPYKTLSIYSIDESFVWQ